MRLYKTSEYAIRVLVYLANHKDGLHSTNKLHKLLNIPYKYLGRLMSKLAAAGFIESVQGKVGGYRLILDEKSIYLYQIVDIVEGMETADRCILGFDSCSDSNPCSLHKYWAPLRESINGMYYNVSLADLANDPNIRY
ncbi:MAG: Rrf2 family transcriptional regulator [Calditrichaceae bacterium]